MIQDNLCEKCSNQNICLAKVKMKPFSDEAKIDLGLTLKIVSCENFHEKD